MAERLARKQRQERTRSHLLAAAGRVFARRGLARASVDEVAAHAGFTKGAVYANFASKEQLFLALLDARFAQRLEELDRALSEHDDPDARARAASAGFMAHLKADPEMGAALLRGRPASLARPRVPCRARHPLRGAARAWRRSASAASPHRAASLRSRRSASR